jgi:GT2 family glycosyltransferase
MPSNSLNISIIIAVYQRNDELKELLDSLVKQTDTDFDVLIVDDGSPTPLEFMVKEYKNQLKVNYFFKENSGPAKSRNYGMKRAEGNYFIFLDSDTIAPSTYIETVRKELESTYVDAFGGPDAADESFTDLQKAISFSMTSILTTGGIRGGKKHLGKFQPRSFNMGISKEAFEATGGFGNLRIGEDPDLSMTLWEKGFQTRLFPSAKVYHKRRTSISKFAKQVKEFGIARPILNQRHPKYVKPTFWFPSLFILGFLGSIFLYLGSFFIESSFRMLLGMPFLLYIFYFQAIIIMAAIQFDSLIVGFLAAWTTMIQFFYYGFGFLNSWIRINLFKQKPEKAFPTHFSN